MANNDINQEIQSRVEAFAAELSDLIRQAALEAVQAALSGDAPRSTPRAGTSRAGAGRPRRAGAGRKKAASRKKATTKKKATSRKSAGAKSTRSRGGKRIRRTEEELGALGDMVLAHVKDHAGDRLEQIGVALNIATSELKRPIANLLEAKALKTTGQRRGTKYFIGSGRRKAS